MLTTCLKPSIASRGSSPSSMPAKELRRGQEGSKLQGPPPRPQSMQEQQQPPDPFSRHSCARPAHLLRCSTGSPRPHPPPRAPRPSTRSHSLPCRRGTKGFSGFSVGCRARSGRAGRPARPFTTQRQLTFHVIVRHGCCARPAVRLIGRPPGHEIVQIVLRVCAAAPDDVRRKRDPTLGWRVGGGGGLSAPLGFTPGVLDTRRSSVPRAMGGKQGGGQAALHVSTRERGQRAGSRNAPGREIAPLSTPCCAKPPPPGTHKVLCFPPCTPLACRYITAHSSQPTKARAPLRRSHSLVTSPRFAALRAAAAKDLCRSVLLGRAGLAGAWSQQPPDLAYLVVGTAGFAR